MTVHERARVSNYSGTFWLNNPGSFLDSISYQFKLHCYILIQNSAFCHLGHYIDGCEILHQLMAKSPRIAHRLCLSLRSILKSRSIFRIIVNLCHEMLDNCQLFGLCHNSILNLQDNVNIVYHEQKFNIEINSNPRKHPIILALFSCWDGHLVFVTDLLHLTQNDDKGSLLPRDGCDLQMGFLVEMMIWRCPKLGRPLVIIHFQMGFSMK